MTARSAERSVAGHVLAPERRVIRRHQVGRIRATGTRSRDHSSQARVAIADRAIVAHPRQDTEHHVQPTVRSRRIGDRGIRRYVVPGIRATRVDARVRRIVPAGPDVSGGGVEPVGIDQRGDLVRWVSGERVVVQVPDHDRDRRRRWSLGETDRQVVVGSTGVRATAGRARCIRDHERIAPRHRFDPHPERVRIRGIHGTGEPNQLVFRRNADEVLEAATTGDEVEEARLAHLTPDEIPVGRPRRVGLVEVAEAVPRHREVVDVLDLIAHEQHTAARDFGVDAHPVVAADPPRQQVDRRGHEALLGITLVEANVRHADLATARLVRVVVITRRRALAVRVAEADRRRGGTARIGDTETGEVMQMEIRLRRLAGRPERRRGRLRVVDRARRLEALGETYRPARAVVARFDVVDDGGAFGVRAEQASECVLVVGSAVGLHPEDETGTAHSGDGRHDARVGEGRARDHRVDAGPAANASRALQFLVARDVDDLGEPTVVRIRRTHRVVQVVEGVVATREVVVKPRHRLDRPADVDHERVGRRRGRVVRAHVGRHPIERGRRSRASMGVEVEVAGLPVERPVLFSAHVIAVAVLDVQTGGGRKEVDVPVQQLVPLRTIAREVRVRAARRQRPRLGAVVDALVLGHRLVERIARHVVEDRIVVQRPHATPRRGGPAKRCPLDVGPEGTGDRGIAGHAGAVARRERVHTVARIAVPDTDHAEGALGRPLRDHVVGLIAVVEAEPGTAHIGQVRRADALEREAEWPPAHERIGFAGLQMVEVPDAVVGGVGSQTTTDDVVRSAPDVERAVPGGTRRRGVGDVTDPHRVGIGCSGCTKRGCTKLRPGRASSHLPLDRRRQPLHHVRPQRGRYGEQGSCSCQPEQQRNKGALCATELHLRTSIFPQNLGCV